MLFQTHDALRFFTELLPNRTEFVPTIFWTHGALRPLFRMIPSSKWFRVGMIPSSKWFRLRMVPISKWFRVGMIPSSKGISKWFRKAFRKDFELGIFLRMAPHTCGDGFDFTLWLFSAPFKHLLYIERFKSLVQRKQQIEDCLFLLWEQQSELPSINYRLALTCL